MKMSLDIGCASHESSLCEEILANEDAIGCRISDRPRRDWPVYCAVWPRLELNLFFGDNFTMQSLLVASTYFVLQS
jgi:hypothetical protein